MSLFLMRNVFVLYFIEFEDKENDQVEKKKSNRLLKSNCLFVLLILFFPLVSDECVRGH